MTENTAVVAKSQLPEGFIDRLKGFIPEADDRKLYVLLASDNPFSREVFDCLDGHYMSLRSGDGWTSLKRLHAASKLGDLLKKEYFPGYAATHPKTA